MPIDPAQNELAERDQAGEQRVRSALGPERACVLVGVGIRRLRFSLCWSSAITSSSLWENHRRSARRLRFFDRSRHGADKASSTSSGYSTARAVSGRRLSPSTDHGVHGREPEESTGG